MVVVVVVDEATDGRCEKEQAEDDFGDHGLWSVLATDNGLLL
jgi:hypothetical protein